MKRPRPHKWVILTREHVDSLLPCADSAGARRAFLPARISTDPERNIPLAYEIWAARAQDNTYWLTWSIGSTRVRKMWGTLTTGRGPFYLEEFWQGESEEIAQWLAWIADWLDITGGGAHPERWEARNA